MKHDHNENEEIEETVIGAIILEQPAQVEAIPLLTPEVFSNDKFRNIFTVIQDMAQSGDDIDLMTVTHNVRAKHPNITAFEITKTTSRVNNTSHIKSWCHKLIELHKKRELLQLSLKIKAKALDLASDVFNDLDTAQHDLLEIASIKSSKEALSMKDMAEQHIEKIERIASGEITAFYDAGLRAVNALQRWRGGELTILAARPGMGKTAVMLQLALNFSKINIPVALFSLEMSSVSLMNRIVSNESQIKLDKIGKADLNAAEAIIHQNTLHRLSKLPIYTDETPSLSVIQLKSKLRKLIAKHEIKFVFIDYLQLMGTSGKKGSRNEHIGEITRTLKSIAKELDIHIFCLSQLSRAVESRGGDKIPQLSDLRDSGEIEQDADDVIFIYRPEYYGITEDETGQSTANRMELYFAKNRNGVLDFAVVHCDLSTQHISNWDSEHTDYTKYEELDNTVLSENNDIDKYLN